jgi:hypothetical protein
MTEEKIQQLKTNMELLEKQTADIKKAREEFELMIENQIVNKQNLENRILSIKSDLTTEALAEFKKTGIKKLLGGLGIQERATISYSPDKAFEFAKEKMLFLQLDKKAFEKVAGSLLLPFVTTGTKTIVTFPKVVKL